MSVTSFSDSHEHLQAELEWLDCALWLMVQRFHQDVPESGGRGWFLSRREVECSLAPPAEDAPDVLALREALHCRRQELDERQLVTAEAGIPLRMLQAEVRLRLSPVERLAVLMCLAAEMHPKYGQVYAYLHDDITRKLPSIGLIQEVAGECAIEGGRIRPLSSALLKWRAIICPDVETFVGPRLAQGMQLDAALCAFLLDEDTDVTPVADTRAHQEIVDRIAALHTGGDRKLAVEFHGAAASDGRRVAKCVSARFGLPLRHARFDGPSKPETLTQTMLEALLHGVALYVSGLSGGVEEVVPLLSIGPAMIYFELERPWFPNHVADNVFIAAFELEVPRYQARLAYWRSVAGSWQLEEGQLRQFASRYHLSYYEIDELAGAARAEAELRGGAGAAVEAGDVVSGARSRSRSSLGALARTIHPKQSWRSLVLPGDSIAQLQEICMHVRQRARVLHDWGFEDRLSLGRGLYVLFAGPSGTGKTLAAEVVAHELGLDLLRVDLSAIVSKYIGETEKNLETVFATAARADAILFFDEADALFGKRSEIKDAHDRYANIEINFLLQRLEEFEGVAILATNFVQNIDDAFSRRIHLTVNFPFPAEDSRLAIWGSHLPRHTPLGEDVDLPWLAEHFEIAGGNIRNVVVNAAFLAADEARPIGMHHFLQAARREYAKMGKPYRIAPVPAMAAGRRNGAEA